MIAKSRTSTQRRRTLLQRGAILIEVIVALAIFVAASTITLRITSSILAALDQSRRQQMAIDLALSTMAELEAGIISLREVRTGMTMGMRGLGERGVDLAADHRWRIEVRTERTAHPGLSLVELTVAEMIGDGLGLPATMADIGRRSEPNVRFTVRRLVPMTEGEVEEYEHDDLLEGLDFGEPAAGFGMGGGGGLR